MRRHLLRLSTISCILFLAACGGGGGDGGASQSGGTAPVTGGVTPGGNGGTGSGDGSWLTLSPSPVRVTTYVNESLWFYVQGKATRAFNQDARVLVLDRNGTLSPQVSYKAIDAYTYNVTLATSPTLLPGTHSTTLEVRVCQDDPLVCAQPFPGSPWYLPLSVEVRDAVASAARVSATPDFRASITEDESAAPYDTFFKLALRVQADAPPSLYARVTDSNRVFMVDALTTSLQRDQTNTIAFKPWRPLNPGAYETTIQVELCRDNRNPCADPFPGSPLRYPVKFDVTPSGNSASRLGVSPASAKLEAFTDEFAPLQISFSGRADLSGKLYASVIDPARYFTDEFVDFITANGTRTVTTRTSSRLQALGPGTYTTVLRVDVCRYFPPAGSRCEAPQPGSPWMIPVSVTLKARPAQ
jgi:hypothetical protein